MKSIAKIININLVILIIILMLSIFLRVYHLNQVPPALFGDEIDVGYQAYSLLHTGKDLAGNSWPFYIRSIAEFRAPLYIYSDIPFIALWGLNEWGVRLSAAFWGVLSVLGMYLLSKQLFSRKVALITAFFMGISPWNLQYSRAGFEVTMLITFIIFAVYFFLIGIKKPIFWLLSAVFFGLTPYIYSTASVFTPLLLLLLGTIFGKSLWQNKKFALPSLVVIFVIVLPILWSVYKGDARARFNLVSIFQDSVLLDKINLARSGEEYSSINGEKIKPESKTEVIFHNKVTVFTQVFTLNYLRAFSFSFLFGQGDPTLRHSIQEMGELYFVDLILIILGIYYLLLKSETKTKLILIGWLLVAPIPAALTTDGGFHATRLILMLPPLLILSGLGLIFLLSSRTYLKRGFSLVLILLLLINVSFYLHRYYLHYPIESWRWWQIGYKEVMVYVGEHSQEYSKIVINNTYEPSLERYLFFNQYDPAKFQQKYQGDTSRANILPGIGGFTFDDHVYFGTLEGVNVGSSGFERAMKPGMLYVASARDEVGLGKLNNSYGAFEVKKIIYNPLGDPIFYLLAGK